jgi:hypothetical protein
LICTAIPVTAPAAFTAMRAHSALPLDDDIVDRILTFCPTFVALQSMILVSKAFYNVFQTHPKVAAVMPRLTSVVYNPSGGIQYCWTRSSTGFESHPISGG